MQEPKLYLKQNVQCEPLFNQWYAWTHLIAPQTAAMFIANLHLKIMRSYVAAPQIHANAVKNPAMLGGPFIDYQGGRVAEIKALADRTAKESAHMIEFAEAVKALNALLQNEAKGYSLEPLYSKIPPALSYTYDTGIERYTYQDLPETIDYVLITHSHQDHVMFETLLQLRHKIKHVIVPRAHGGNLEDPSTKRVLENIGFRNVIEIDEMETIHVPDGSITALPFFGEHCDLNIGTKAAHLIKLKNKSLLLAADSNNIEPELYRHLYGLVGEIAVLFLGMECDGAPMSWLYGPLLSKPLDRKMDQSRRLSGSNYERGMQIVDCFNCKEVYVYALGQEPWLTYALSLKYTDESHPIIDSNKLMADCHNRGVISERLFGHKEC